MTRLIIAIPLALMSSTASAENICYRQMNPLDYQCRYDATRNRCDCREVRHGEGNRPQSTPTPTPEPEPECKGKCEPDRETDPDGWQHWRDETPRTDRRGEHGETHGRDGRGEKEGK